jgi:hypothetical protein
LQTRKLRLCKSTLRRGVIGGQARYQVAGFDWYHREEKKPGIGG